MVRNPFQDGGEARATDPLLAGSGNWYPICVQDFDDRTIFGYCHYLTRSHEFDLESSVGI